MNPGDVVAVLRPPGPEWAGIVAEVWEIGAALLPIDPRLQDRAAASLVARARPTVVLDTDGWTRADGVSGTSDLALVVATSGTGGEPKLVELSRASVKAAVEGSAAMLGSGLDEPWLCCLPLAHIGGLLAVLRSVLTGAPVVIHERFDPDRVATMHAAYIPIVPTMLKRLLDANVDLSSFEAILVGGAPLAVELRARAAQAGARIVETYGLTESCGGVVYDARPFPGTELRVGPDDEIRLRGPTVMTGYRFDPEATGRAFTDDGWLRTGDAGSLGADGYVRVDGRLDDIIITGGEKVRPERVEAVLRRLPSVADVAVAGRPDPEWGQRVVAFVVPTDPSAPPSLDQLRDYVVRGQLPRYEAPRDLVLLEALPRTVSGKLRRGDLPAE